MSDKATFMLSLSTLSRDDLHTELWIADHRLATAEHRVATLTEALRHYAQHKFYCRIFRAPYLGRDLPGSECSCGLRAALDPAAGNQ
jgi:hypothetical protein